MHCSWEYKLAKTLENNTEVPKKLKVELPHDPATPLLGVYPKKTKPEMCTSVFTAALTTIAKIRKQPIHQRVNG